LKGIDLLHDGARLRFCYAVLRSGLSNVTFPQRGVRPEGFLVCFVAILEHLGSFVS
jgi:hypothetical protein